jgi:hypothetical protein
MDIATLSGVHRRGHLVCLGVFEQIPRRSRGQGRMDLLFLDEAGQRYDLDLGISSLDFRGRRDSVHARHDDVHEYDVGQLVVGGQARKVLERFLAIACLPDNFHVVQHFQIGGYAAPDDAVVVNQHDANGGRIHPIFRRRISAHRCISSWLMRRYL